MKLLILLFLTNIAHATYDPSLQNLQLDMMYSAKVSSAGVVSEESKDFINGNCVASGTGSATFTCTFNTGIFTVTPNCVAASSTQGWAATVSTSTTASQAVVQTEYIVTPAPNADSFKVSCQKQGVDYLTASSAVYSVQNQNYAATSAAYTMSWVSNATVSGTVTRYGDRAYFEGMVVLTGAPTSTGLSITLPSGFVIDVAKVPGGVGNVRTSYGITKVFDSSAGTSPGQGQVRGNSSTTVNLDFWNGSAQQVVSDTAPMVFATGDSVYFKFDVPIVGWTAAPFAIASIAGYGSAPGVAGSANQSVDFFSFTYGTTNATTACTASPCSYLDQIGTAVSSVTRSGTGAYTMNLARTYAKLKCTSTMMAPGVAEVFFSGNAVLNCSNCSTLSWAGSRQDTGAAVDSNGTIICQGNY